MSFGLRVWDAQGRVTLDNVDNVGRLFATVEVPALSGTQPVFVSVPGLDPSRIVYSLSDATHTHLAIELVAGGVRAWLTQANSQIGTWQPSFSMHLILTR